MTKNQINKIYKELERKFSAFKFCLIEQDFERAFEMKDHIKYYLVKILSSKKNGTAHRKKVTG